VLNDLSNVQGSPTNGQVLTYNTSASKWEPETPSFTGALSALSDHGKSQDTRPCQDTPRAHNI